MRLLPLLLAACIQPPETTTSIQTFGGRDNVLIVLLDDLGVEVTGTYGLDDGAVLMPSLDRVAARGITFDRAYAMPTCSPSRAAMLTGQQPARFGMGNPIDLSDPDESFLPEDSLTIPEVLARDELAGWTSALVGKWHLTLLDDDPVDGPLRHGFDVFTGTVGNLQKNHALDGDSQTYLDWELVRDGELTRVTDYATTVMIDETIAMVQALPEPWFVVLSLQAVHSPWLGHPEALTDLDEDALRAASIPDRHRALVRATDLELARLWDGLGDGIFDRAHVIVAGDNGSDSRTLPENLEDFSAKSTVRELGVRVPFIVAGPAVDQPGRRSDHLVHLMDVFPTSMALAGVPHELVPEVDALSFADLVRDASAPTAREVLYTEYFTPDGRGGFEAYSRALRDDRWKYIRKLDGSEELFDLGEVWLEGEDLLAGVPDAEALQARDRLSDRVDDGEY